MSRRLRLRAFAYENLMRFGSKSTRLVGLLWGERFPFWYVCEYPKCGGTWLGRMVSGYLDIPFPQHTVFPIGMTCVVHNHWQYHPRMSRCFYLYRDGRDVMVSYYFHRMRNLATAPEHPFHRMLAQRYERALGPGYDPDDIQRHLPTFIDLEMREPRGSRLSWSEHVRGWLDRPHDQVVYLAYEQLLEDAHGTLSRCLGTFLDGPIDDERLALVIDRYSFQRMAGRRPGQEDRASFARKGIAGDWKNHFTQEAAQVFDHHAGDALIALGYESDRSWVRRCGVDG